MKRAQPEQALQRQVTQFLAAALLGNSFFSAIPLGGGGRTRGVVLKSTGTKSGLPDILVINDGRAIWFELKAPRGRVSDAQLYCHAGLKKAHSPVYVVRSLDDVIAALTAAGVPLRLSPGSSLDEVMA